MFSTFFVMRLLGRWKTLLFHFSIKITPDIVQNICNFKLFQAEASVGRKKPNQTINISHVCWLHCHVIDSMCKKPLVFRTQCHSWMISWMCQLIDIIPYQWRQHKKYCHVILTWFFVPFTRIMLQLVQDLHQTPLGKTLGGHGISTQPLSGGIRQMASCSTRIWRCSTGLTQLMTMGSWTVGLEKVTRQAMAALPARWIPQWSQRLTDTLLWVTSDCHPLVIQVS